MKMGDEDDRTEFVISNLTVLCESTIIGTQFVLRLYQMRLIDVEEKHILSNHDTPNITKAMKLYTEIGNKWSQCQFEVFVKTLEDTGNSKAYQVFSNTGADCFLTNEQVLLLRQQRNKSEGGFCEGLCYEDEEIGNRVVQYARQDLFCKDGKFKLSAKLERKEVIRLVRKFADNMNNETIWWNDRKTPFPRIYIPRRLYCPSENINFQVDTRTLTNLMKQKLMVVVNHSGMGKTSEITNLEKQLRMNIANNRIVLRINLNQVQSVLSTMCENEDTCCALTKLAPFVNSKALKRKGVSVFVLLDGLDEVCPTYQDTMIRLLRILHSSEEPSDLHVVVTTRPHLKEPLESEFKIRSWSLLPLSVEEQQSYMSAMGVPIEKVALIRNKFTHTDQFILSNPLMLSMLVEILKSRSTLSAADMNTYDIYSQFVEGKHELQCVEKLSMDSRANLTKIFKKSMLSNNLPFYYFITLRQLMSQDFKRSPAFTELIGRVAKDPQQTANGPNTTTELLSYGLLVEDREGKLVFEHRSFAEFFYAKLLTQEESTPQIVRDTIFGHIYRSNGVLENVEAFVESALSIGQRKDGNPLLKITTKWIFTEDDNYTGCSVLRKFTKGKLFPLCAPEVLMTFAEGDPGDMWDAFQVLLDNFCRKTLSRLFEWMNKNVVWTRNNIFKLDESKKAKTVTKTFPAHVTNLMVAVAVRCQNQMLLSNEEVRLALNSCDRLIYIVASIETEYSGEMKWDYVQDRLEDGRLKDVMLKMNDEDFPRVIEDLDTAWKLVSTLTEEDLHCLVSKEDTRVTDIVGKDPRKVSTVLGNHFISGLTEFRAKFGSDKGKTVFELSGGGWDFALDFLWEDLLKEKQDDNSNGRVVMALREAIGRSPSDLIYKLHNQLGRRKRCPSCPSQSFLGRDNKECEQVMEWILEGRFLWDFKNLVNLLKECKHKPIPEWTLKVALRSLIYAATSGNKNISSFYPQVATFLQENLNEGIQETLGSLIKEFVCATREEIAKAAPIQDCSCLPFYDASLGRVFLRLTKPSGITIDEECWKVVLSDIIEFTPCCDFPAVFHELQQKFRNSNRLLGILKHKEVLSRWTKRFSSRWRKKDQDWDFCGLSHLLSFYFSVFGLNFLWMRSVSGNEIIMDGWDLLKSIPVELGTVLEKNVLWIHLLPQFQQLLRMSLPKELHTVREVLISFSYRTEGEWKRLIHLIALEDRLQPASPAEGEIESSKAVPFIRVLVEMFGVDEAKVKIKHLWSCLPSYIRFQCDTPDTLGSLLHFTIELEEVEEVERRAYPGLLLWRNPQGKTALQVAVDKYDQFHPIRLHLQKLTLSRHIGSNI